MSDPDWKTGYGVAVDALYRVKEIIALATMATSATDRAHPVVARLITAMDMAYIEAAMGCVMDGGHPIDLRNPHDLRNTPDSSSGSAG